MIAKLNFVEFQKNVSRLQQSRLASENAALSSPIQFEEVFKPPVRDLRLKNGGDDGIRTHDPLLAGQVLSQLSYTPIHRVTDGSVTEN